VVAKIYPLLRFRKKDFVVIRKIPNLPILRFRKKDFVVIRKIPNLPILRFRKKDFVAIIKLPILPILRFRKKHFVAIKKITHFAYFEIQEERFCCYQKTTHFAYFEIQEERFLLLSKKKPILPILRFHPNPFCCCQGEDCVERERESFTRCWVKFWYKTESFTQTIHQLLLLLGGSFVFVQPTLH
jgi:hypothetical protein